ncbi:MAG TPA: GNAT family N-acetyltransferase [Clostridia bacterium]|nr:GNAT family N-acetyltransferase [Clostridia bacterium]
MTFVELQEHHLPMIARHYVETYNAPPWEDAWTEELALQKLEEMMDCSGAFGLVGQYDSGLFAGVILGNTELYFNCKQFFVKDFFVPLALQGSGFGSALMAELERRLTGMGVEEIYLFTAKGERTEGFYQKRGFRRWEHMVLMGKRIEPAEPDPS